MWKISRMGTFHEKCRGTRDRYLLEEETGEGLTEADQFSQSRHSRSGILPRKQVVLIGRECSGQHERRTTQGQSLKGFRANATEEIPNANGGAPASVITSIGQLSVVLRFNGSRQSHSLTRHQDVPKMKRRESQALPNDRPDHLPLPNR